MRRPVRGAGSENEKAALIYAAEVVWATFGRPAKRGMLIELTGVCRYSAKAA
jgi:hypothetical protein